MDNSEYLEKIDELAKENKIAFMTIDGLMTANINEIINQPSEGILYDLNRDEATIRTLAESSKNVRWINDLAFVKVFKKVFSKYQEQKEIILSLEKEIDNLKDKLSNIKKDENKQEVKEKELREKFVDTAAHLRNVDDVPSVLTEGFDDSVVFQI